VQEVKDVEDGQDVQDVKDLQDVCGAQGERQAIPFLQFGEVASGRGMLLGGGDSGRGPHCAGDPCLDICADCETNIYVWPL